MPVQPVPAGYHTVTPYLVVRGVDRLIDFLKQAFGAVEIHRMSRPDGSVGHAEMKIGDSPIMMGEPMGDQPPMPAVLYVYLDDMDTVYCRALDAGATSISEPADQFYGDRHGGVKDPCGNLWWIATHIEDVSPEEIARRAAAKR
ncbi:MAG TPA: VOC family protein [Pirellulales bacterium]|nr:VOC family protein [Pirellulales bacterium]